MFLSSLRVPEGKGRETSLVTMCERARVSLTVTSQEKPLLPSPSLCSEVIGRHFLLLMDDQSQGRSGRCKICITVGPPFGYVMRLTDRKK